MLLGPSTLQKIKGNANEVNHLNAPGSKGKQPEVVKRKRSHCLELDGALAFMREHMGIFYAR